MIQYGLLEQLTQDAITNLQDELHSQTDKIIITVLQDRINDFEILLKQVELEKIKNLIR